MFDEIIVASTITCTVGSPGTGGEGGIDGRDGYPGKKIKKSKKSTFRDFSLCSLNRFSGLPRVHRSPGSQGRARTGGRVRVRRSSRDARTARTGGKVGLWQEKNIYVVFELVATFRKGEKGEPGLLLGLDDRISGDKGEAGNF